MHRPRPLMQPDTRKLLTTGLGILAVGAAAAAAVPLFFHGFSDHGPTTNGGWFCLVIALGCCPTAVLTLALALLKLVGDRNKPDPEPDTPFR